MSQAENIVSFYSDDKKELWRIASELRSTVDELSQLVNFKTAKRGDKIVEFDDESFFTDAAPVFNHLLTRLSALAIGIPTSRWLTPIVESYQTAPPLESAPEHDGEEKPSWRQQLTSLPKRIASGTFSFLAPTPMPLDREELQQSVNTLQAEFTRLRLLVEDGWQGATESRLELAQYVSQTVGWIHSETFQRAVEHIMEIDRIGGGVFKEIT